MDENRFFELISKDKLRTKICRMCLGENSSLYNIHNKSYREFESISLLLGKISLQVPSNDGYPEVICRKCLDEAVQVYEFFKKCDQSYYNLTEYFDSFLEKIKNITNSKDDFFDGNSILFLVPENEILIIENDHLQFNVNTQEYVQSELNGIKKEFDYCDESINIIDDDKENFKTSLTFPLQCPECQLPFLRMLDLQQHMINGSHGLRCNICHSVCKSKAQETKHLLKHSKNLETQCRYCGALLKNSVHTNKDFRFKCDKCNHKYPCSVFLERHIENNHSESRTLKSKKTDTDVVLSCEFCNLKFTNERMYKHHVKTHNKIFICDYCGRTEKTKTMMAAHINRHLGIKPIKCKFCNKTFYTCSELTCHSIVHTRERKHQCEICGAKLVTKKALQYHRRLHTGEKPFKCELCEQSFLSASRRSMHVKLEHMEKVECSICLRKFSHATINRHILRHTNTTVKRPRLFRIQPEQTALLLPLKSNPDF